MNLFPEENEPKKEVEMNEKQTLKDIQEQIKALQAQEAQIIAQEKEEVVQYIREKVAEFHLQPEDIFGGGSRKASAGSKKPKMIRYKRGENEVWAGRGKKPDWCANMSKEELEQYKLDTPIPAE
ncbi:MAG: H-NS histone family protein [Prosthecochloris sp.]|nr:H-NS histone family protein [Prosthecochloris ethylica]MEC9487600.1 H-NS histone family protein [Prosthecochloris sp.]